MPRILAPLNRGAPPGFVAATICSSRAVRLVLGETTSARAGLVIESSSSNRPIRFNEWVRVFNEQRRRIDFEQMQFMMLEHSPVTPEIADRCSHGTGFDGAAQDL